MLRLVFELLNDQSRYISSTHPLCPLTFRQTSGEVSMRRALISTRLVGKKTQLVVFFF